MSDTRIYCVRSALKGHTERLIRASSQAQALRHAACTVFRVQVASQDDIVHGLSNGTKVETAGETLENTAP